MGWFEAVVLGVLQGITEFLPISSSGHVRVFSALFGWKDPGAAFTAVIQIGTETAVIVYFWKDLTGIVATWSRSLFQPQWRPDPRARMGWFIILGSLPIVVIGFTFQETIETALRNLVVVGLALIIFGAILGIADALAANRRTLDDLTVRSALIFGFAQCLALIPGVSRSGGTITAGLLMGFTRKDAARYSFLLAIPAVLGSATLEALKIGEDGSPSWGPTIVAAAIAFGVGLGVIHFFMKWISTHTFTPFVLYRFVLGAAVLLLLGAGVLDPYA